MYSNTDLYCHHLEDISMTGNEKKKIPKCLLSFIMKQHVKTGNSQFSSSYLIITSLGSTDICAQHINIHHSESERVKI